MRLELEVHLILPHHWQPHDPLAWLDQHGNNGRLSLLGTMLSLPVLSKLMTTMQRDERNISGGSTASAASVCHGSRQGRGQEQEQGHAAGEPPASSSSISISSLLSRHGAQQLSAFPRALE